jgi:hypothetical protein
VPSRRAAPVYLRTNRLGRLMRNWKSTDKGRGARSDIRDTPRPSRDPEVCRYWVTVNPTASVRFQVEKAPNG